MTPYLSASFFSSIFAFPVLTSTCVKRPLVQNLATSSWRKISGRKTPSDLHTDKKQISLTVFLYLFWRALTLDSSGSQWVSNGSHAVRLSGYTCWQGLFARRPAAKKVSVALIQRAAQLLLEPVPRLSTCVMATIRDRVINRLCHADHRNIRSRVCPLPERWWEMYLLLLF